ncbi:protein ninY, partial [Salmonella enterica subsp. enterica serovar Typhimurium]|nr:protein ninY [Salmonella enterica subsp. enterica serovar Typhimurium]EDG0248017.1 protein ninY [Salmonella enterica subsp. enterica serovar Typhimurium]EDG7438957.1 protein ninY [Salmonella enterica subsp. enterica serovar Typhimurium]
KARLLVSCWGQYLSHEQVIREAA